MLDTTAIETTALSYDLSDLGRLVAACLEHHDIVVHVGGRGSGKTINALIAMCHWLLRHPGINVLVLRESHSGLLQMFSDLYQMLCFFFGEKAVSQNKNAGTITLANGTVIELRCMADERAYVQIQGKSYQFLLADEMGNYSKAGFDLTHTVLSNMRGPKGLHCPAIFLGNPYGKSHAAMHKQYLSKSPFWESYVNKAGLRIIHCHSTLRQNPHIDHEAYVRRIKVACNGDEEREKAWIDGSWSLNLTSFFGHCWDPKHHLLPSGLIAADLLKHRPTFRIGADWGTRSACAAHLGAKLRSDLYLPDQDRWLRSGSVLLLGETHTLADITMQDLASGTGIAPAGWAEKIKHMAITEQGLRATPPVAQDDARGLQGDTVSSLMAQAGVPCHRPHKDRRGGWALMTQYLSNAMTGDGPGLYVSPSCEYLLETLPHAPANKHDPSDTDPKWDADHSLDACQYTLSFLVSRQGRYGRIRGDF